MVERKTVQLKRLANGRSEEIRWGRWLRNKKVTEKMLIQSELSRTSQLVKGRHVLAIQDTTEINYQAHVKRVRGLGTVGNGKDVGLYLHPLLVIDADKKACIGFGAMKTWLRKSASPDYAKLPIESKESYRWIETAEQGKETLKEADVVTFVGDRESDIYEYLDRIPDERYHLLTRCSQKHRCLSNGQKLEEYLSSLKEAAQLRITVPREMRKGRVKRQADLSIKYGEIEIQRPANRKDNQGSKTVKLRVVEAKESHVPEGQKPIHWILLTTHEVNSPEEAKQIIGWYQCRWQIEQLFRTLKSQGLNIESSQVEEGTNLRKLVIMATCAALKIMQLVMSREGTSQQKTSTIFNKSEQLLLALILKQLEGKTALQKNPYTQDNLGWGAWIIGRLGGWKGYKSEGPVGPITMGRGLMKFYDMYAGWRLTKDVYTE